MEFLDNKTPQVEFDNIEVFILAVMLTIKEELVNVNGYGDIDTNDEAAHNVHIFCFALSVPYTLQEDVESDENQLAYGDLFCDAIYTSPGQYKSRFNLETFTRKKL